MTTSFEIIEKAKDLIQANVHDLNSSRRAEGGKWVHTDWPKFSAASPRAAVFLVDGPAEGVGIGTYERRQRLRFQVSVFVKTDNSYLSPDDNETFWNAEKSASYLTNEIIKLINGNPDLDALDTVKEIVFMDETRNDVSGMVQRNLDFECMLRRDD